MRNIQLNENHEISLKVGLTQGQIAKFNSLARNLIIRNGVAYVPLDELHGVLLTTSRQRAKDIVNAYRSLIRQFLIDTDDIAASIVPVGLLLLLDQLTVDNPRKAIDYRASAALLACIVASNTQLAFEAQILTKEKNRDKEAIFAKLKKKYKQCQLSGVVFGSGVEKHVHHIMPEALYPALAADESNLIVISGKVHRDYHDWTHTNGLEICKATLKNFARRNNYDWECLQA